MLVNVKKVLFLLYSLVVVLMGVATFVEHSKGTEYVSVNIYGSWWFCLLWALLAVVAICYFLKSKVKNIGVVLLHLSFIVILAGAFLTYVFADKGFVHLRLDKTTDEYLVDKGGGNIVTMSLPFTLRLDKFDVEYHSGTDAAQDYVSVFTIIDGDKQEQGKVSMNNIYTYKNMRLYQRSYDSDGKGSYISVNSDPYGIPVTYTGYALLFLSLIWMLFDPKGAYRRILRSPILKKGILVIVALVSFSQGVNAATVLPKETAEKFGQLNILYNDRICPLQTFAIDFTKKLYGSANYKDYTPEQVITGFIFWGDEWSAEPIIKMKSGALRETLQLPKYVSVNTFFNRDMGGYIIGPYIREYYNGNQDEFHKQAGDVDSRIQLVMDLRHGSLLKVFPFTEKGKTTWYSPTEKITDKSINEDHRKYMQNVFSLIYQEALAGNNGHIDQILDKMLKYQKVNAGNSLPTDNQIKAERLYNSIPFATILFMVNLTMGFLTLFFSLYRLTRKTHVQSVDSRENKTVKIVNAFTVVVLFLSFIALTVCLALRWIISGTVPMSNGYETMLLMAWLIMLLSFIVCHRFRIILTFGFLMSGFFLLVSHINQMDPQISHIMPVLNSPLLSIHVSIIMMSFALLSLTFICGLMAIALRLIRGKYAVGLNEQAESLRLLSDIFLYPALTALGLGIFIGAIWANVSWGTYWSWDAKEVWGLITFMIYALSVHRKTLPFLCKPMGYHLFMVIAFLSIIMTYFGVNYFLGGMHSYA